MENLKKILKDIMAEYCRIKQLYLEEEDELQRLKYMNELSKIYTDLECIKSALRIMRKYSNQGTIPAAGNRRLSKKDRRESVECRIAKRRLHKGCEKEDNE